MSEKVSLINATNFKCFCCFIVIIKIKNHNHKGFFSTKVHNYHLNSNPLPNTEKPILLGPMEPPVPRNFASTPDGPMLPPVFADRPTVAFAGPTEAEALNSSASAKALTSPHGKSPASTLALGPRVLHSTEKNVET